MTKDSIGNKLSEGQFVQVRFPGGLSALNGRIKSISEGRIVTGVNPISRGKQENAKPGTMTVEILVPMDIDAVSGTVPFVTRLHDPSGKDLQLAEMQTESVS